LLPKLSFTGGVWAPNLHARSDLAKYNTAVKRLENMIIHPHGPVSNRGGTKFITEVKTSSQRSRLVPFQFSVYQSYILEFGRYYMRVIKDGGLVIESADAGLDIVDAAVYKWTLSSSGTSEYHLELLAGGDPELDEPEKVYESNSAMYKGTPGSLSPFWWAYGNNDSLGYNTIYARLVDSTDPDTKGDGHLEAGYIEEIVTPYLAADLATLYFAQSADTLYVCHPDYAPRKITRTDHDRWSIETISFGSSINPPANFNSNGAGAGHTAKYTVTAVKLNGEESTRTSIISTPVNSILTWDARAGADHYNIYKDSALSEAFGWVGYAVDEQWQDPRIDDYGLRPDYAKSPPEGRDPLDGADNRPGVCAFHEQRLVFARANSAPQTILGSMTGLFENLNTSTPLQDDDSFTFTMNDLQINEIRWLIPLIKGMLIGTSGSEWFMSPGGSSDAITPSSVLLLPQSKWGSAQIQPVIVGDTILFIGRSQHIIRDLRYTYETDGYAGNDITIMANHLFKGFTLVNWAYQKSPDSIIWCVRSDGKLLGLTYYREHEVWGWHLHETDGLFISVASITNGDGDDELYAIVERVIDGSTVKYIERFEPRLPMTDISTYDIQDAFFVDCGLSLDVPLTITAATKADPVVITSSAHGLSNGDLVDIVEVAGMTELNGRRFKVTDKGTNYFKLADEDDNDIDGTGYTTYISGGKAREAVTSISGLDHLEGEDVAVLANGNVVSGKTVSSGAITLSTAASKVHVGLAYTSTLELLHFIVNDQKGTTQGKLSSIAKAVFSLENTRALNVGPNVDSLVEVNFRTDELLGDPTRLFTGNKRISLRPGSKETDTILIQNTDPLPITLAAVIADVDYGD